MTVSPDGAIGVSPTGGKRGRGRHQCPRFLYRHSSPRRLGPHSGDRPPRRSSWRIGGVDRGASRDRVRAPRHGDWFPMGDSPEEHEDLLEEFVMAAEAIVNTTSAQDVVNKIFD